MGTQRADIHPGKNKAEKPKLKGDWRLKIRKVEGKNYTKMLGKRFIVLSTVWLKNKNEMWDLKTVYYLGKIYTVLKY